MYAVYFDDGDNSFELDTFDNFDAARAEFQHQIDIHDADVFGEFELVRLDNQGDYDYTIQWHSSNAE